MDNAHTFNPTKFEPKAYVNQRSATDKKFKVAYDALEDEVAAVSALLRARTKAGLTQAEVASRRGVTQPVVARIEASLGKKKPFSFTQYPASLC